MAREKLDAIGTEAIASKIADGATYREIAGEAGVGLGTFAAWIEADAERSQACARAREISAQAFEERAQEVIEDASDPFELAKAKELAVHWRWRAKAVNPRRYGDKVQQEHTGPGGGPVQFGKLEVVIVDSKG
jgi:transposase